MTKTRRVTRRDAHEAVAGLEPFTYNRSSTGQWTTLQGMPSGVLTREISKGLEEFAGAKDTIVYAVYSYDTPIAVYAPHKGWWVWNEKYSPTTTTHQGFVRSGIRDRGEIPALTVGEIHPIFKAA